MFIRIVCAVSVCCFSASSLFADGPNWPQWRGPNGSGKTSAVGILTQWGPDQNVKWRIDLPEAGNGTPIAWDNKIFVTQPFSESNERGILCIDRVTGTEQWRRGVVYDKDEPTHRTNPYCSASPVTDGERVIAWFGSAGVVCWDFEGNELWRRELGIQNHMWGYGASPILYDDMCIVSFGPGDEEFIIGLDKKTGETRWKVDALDNESELALSGPENDGNANDRDSDKERNELLRGSWNTPIIVNANGEPELIVALPRRVSAFDPTTGEELWTCGGFAPLAYASLIEHEGVVIALGGYGGASMAIKTGGRGDVTETHRLWHKSEDVGWLGTGVAHDGAFYVCNMNGVIFSFDVETGEELWKSRGDGGGTWSSITQTADGVMYMLTKTGATTVFRPDRDELKKIALNELGESTNASVVVVGNEVLIRTDKALWCFE